MLSHDPWMSQIKIIEQRVATWSEHVWLISVTVDAVYKVCPWQRGWCRNSSWMQPCSPVAALNVKHLSHVCRLRLVRRLLSLKKACVSLSDVKKSLLTPLIGDSSKVRITLYMMTLIDVSSFAFFCFFSLLETVLGKERAHLNSGTAGNGFRNLRGGNKWTERYKYPLAYFVMGMMIIYNHHGLMLCSFSKW